jgi:hypothetical protein
MSAIFHEVRGVSGELSAAHPLYLSHGERSAQKALGEEFIHPQQALKPLTPRPLPVGEGAGQCHPIIAEAAGYWAPAFAEMTMGTAGTVRAYVARRGAR